MLKGYRVRNRPGLFPSVSLLLALKACAQAQSVPPGLSDLRGVMVLDDGGGANQAARVMVLDCIDGLCSARLIPAADPLSALLEGSPGRSHLFGPVAAPLLSLSPDLPPHSLAYLTPNLPQLNPARGRSGNGHRLSSGTQGQRSLCRRRPVGRGCVARDGLSQRDPLLLQRSGKHANPRAFVGGQRRPAVSLPLMAEL